MHTFYRGLGRFTVKFRWLIVIAWVLGAVTLVRAMPSLASQVNNENTAFLPAGAPDVKAAALAQPLLGKASAEPVTVVAVSSHGPLTTADLASVGREVQLARDVPGISRVQFTGESRNHQAVLVTAVSTAASMDPQHAKTIVDSIIHSFPKAGAPPGLHFYVSGQVADGVYQNAQSRTTGNLTQLLSILFIIALLFLIFRSVLAPFVTLLPAAIVLTVAGAIIGEIASHGVLKVSEVTELLLIVLVLGAGTDYGLFLVYRVREGLRKGLDPKDAVALAVERVGESITASAGTVVIALLTLTLASFGIYHDLGVPLAIGIATMLISGLTLLPALLAILGRAVFWPSKPREGQLQAGGWGRVAGRIVSRPGPTLAVGLVVFGTLAAGAIWYSPSGFGGDEAAPAHTLAAQGDAQVKHYFAQSSANPTNLVVELPTSAFTDPAQLTAVTTKLRASGLFTTINTPLSPSGSPISGAELQALHRELGPPRSLPPVPPRSATIPLAVYEQYRAEAQYISPNGRIVQFAAGLKAGDPGGTKALRAVPQIRDVLAGAAGSVHATDWGVAGEAAALADISSTSDADLFHIVPIAALAIAFLLALVLRSLVAPFYLIFSVVLSYLAALGLSTVVFVKLGGSGGLTFLLPFLMFIFLLALGEDYNILVMTRIREEAHDHSLKEAVVRAVGASGPTITSAGLVLAGSFGVLAFAGSTGPGGGQVRDIGVGLALGILMDTFLVRTLLVPSTVVLLGRWNWWPGHIEAGMGYPGTDTHHRWRLRQGHLAGGGPSLGRERAAEAGVDTVLAADAPGAATTEPVAAADASGSASTEAAAAAPPELSGASER
jgi:RND superfamily putative drug exporter